MKPINLIFLCLFLAGCSGIQNAVKTSDDPNCTTVVEGMFKSKPMYAGNGGAYEGKVPALFIKTSSYETKNIHGKILQTTSDGIVFDQDREGPFYDPEPKLYYFKDIACAIDSARNITYGALPQKNSVIWDMEIVMKRTDDTTLKPIRVEFKANEKFSFCMPPGSYTAEEMRFVRGEDIDISVSVPVFSFQVRSGKVNYVGDILLDVDTSDVPGVCIVPYKMEKRPSVGAAFGLIGAMVQALATDYSVHTGHRMRVSIDDHFTTAMHLPVESSIAKLEPNPFIPKKDEKK